MNVQVIKSEKGVPIGVFLTIKQYKKIMDELENLDAIRAYDRVKAKTTTVRDFDSVLQR
jgi:hypothetical protein